MLIVVVVFFFLSLPKEPVSDSTLYFKDSMNPTG
jgi:hypothetical protein